MTVTLLVLIFTIFLTTTKSEYWICKDENMQLVIVKLFTLSIISAGDLDNEELYITISKKEA